MPSHDKLSEANEHSLHARLSPSRLAQFVCYVRQLEALFPDNHAYCEVDTITGEKREVSRYHDDEGRLYSIIVSPGRVFDLQELSQEQVGEFCVMVAGIRGVKSPNAVYDPPEAPVLRLRPRPAEIGYAALGYVD